MYHIDLSFGLECCTILTDHSVLRVVPYWKSFDVCSSFACEHSVNIMAPRKQPRVEADHGQGPTAPSPPAAPSAPSAPPPATAAFGPLPCLFKRKLEATTRMKEEVALISPERETPRPAAKAKPTARAFKTAAKSTARAPAPTPAPGRQPPAAQAPAPVANDEE